MHLNGELEDVIETAGVSIKMPFKRFPDEETFTLTFALRLCLMNVVTLDIAKDISKTFPTLVRYINTYMPCLLTNIPRMYPDTS